MHNIMQKFRQSAQELRRTRTLAVTSLFIALNLAMTLMGLRIQVTDQLRITFSFIAEAMIAMLYGPVVAATSGVVTDVLAYIIRPSGGPFFPGFTITAILSGFIYGLFLYRKPINIWRPLAAKTIINVFLNTGLNSVWLHILYGSPLILFLPERVFKNIVFLPIEVILLYMAGSVIQRSVMRYSME